MALNLAPYAIAWLLSGCVGLYLALYGLATARLDLAVAIELRADSKVTHQARVILRSWRIRTVIQILVILLALLTIATGRPALPSTAHGLAMLALEARRWVFFAISVMIAWQSLLDIADYPGDGT